MQVQNINQLHHIYKKYSQSAITELLSLQEEGENWLEGGASKPLECAQASNN